MGGKGGNGHFLPFLSPLFPLSPAPSLISVSLSSFSYICSLLFSQKPSLFFFPESHAPSFLIMYSFHLPTHLLLICFCTLGRCLGHALTVSLWFIRFSLPRLFCRPSTSCKQTHFITWLSCWRIGSFGYPQDQINSSMALVYLLSSACYPCIHSSDHSFLDPHAGVDRAPSHTSVYSSCLGFLVASFCFSCEPVSILGVDTTPFICHRGLQN